MPGWEVFAFGAPTNTLILVGGKEQTRHAGELYKMQTCAQFEDYMRLVPHSRIY